MLIFAPRPAAGIDQASASVDSPFGQVGIEWRVADGELVADVELPFGTTGELRPPESVESVVTVDGSPSPSPVDLGQVPSRRRHDADGRRSSDGRHGPASRGRRRRPMTDRSRRPGGLRPAIFARERQQLILGTVDHNGRALVAELGGPGAIVPNEEALARDR